MGSTPIAAIRCEALGKSYGKVVALRSLDLEIAHGTIFGFLGRNGAGKTTTIRLLTGLAHPTTGRAWVMGVETTGQNEAARSRFGYLPQTPAFYSWMTPVEYLDYCGRLFRMEDSLRKRRIAEMLELTQLKEAARRKIGGFSGGMHQRLGVAQALLHEPPVLFLDEPTSSLDPAGRYELLDLIYSLRGQVTVFLSSHILGDVERVCDTIGVIHEGRLVVVSPREALLAQYATNAVDIEFDPSCLPLPEDFLQTLSGQPWVSSLAMRDHTLHVIVQEIEPARQQLLPLVVGHRLLVNRYEWVRPSLEEIFLGMTGAESHPGKEER